MIIWRVSMEGGERMEEEKKDEKKEEHQWYAIYTYSGHENKVKINLEKRLVSLNLKDKVSEILIPSEEVAEIKGGRKRVTTRKFFPGYILIKMKLDEDTWRTVKETPGVFEFVGNKRAPSPLDPGEVESILKRVGEAEGKITTKTKFKTGENVRIIDGPFLDFLGVVKEVNPKQERLKVMIAILGRSTPVELDFLQVEKI
jgi:transcriptional antiterminator NusG